MADNVYKSYFGPRRVAERYLHGRPRYHSFVIGKIHEFLRLELPLDQTLDVGCGTGFSSVALKRISESVVGCDLSAEMLSFAEDAERVEYVISSGETLPFTSNGFDLITVAQAIHWMDREKFLAEAGRLLKPNSWLIAYDNYFQGRIAGDSAFNNWYRESFLGKFPTPARNRLPFATESKNADELILAHEDRHENVILLTQRNLTEYLITITNVIDLVENGNDSIENVGSWLDSHTKSFFEDNDSQEFIFSAPIWYFRRAGEI